MTEQWRIISEEFISYDGGCAQVISNGDCKIYLWHNKEEAQRVCDLLNDLNDEKVELKEYARELLTALNTPIKHRKSIVHKKELLE